MAMGSEKLLHLDKVDLMPMRRTTVLSIRLSEKMTAGVIVVVGLVDR